MAHSDQNHHYQGEPATFQPSSWSYESIESIGNQNNHVGVDDEQKSNKMEEEIRCMLDDEDLDPLTLLELIDDIHRLGLGYKFLESSRKALYKMNLLQSELKIHDNLHSCALYFRLLRLHGFHISTDIFESFKGSDGNYNAKLTTDIGGMLSLYEASFLAFDGERMPRLEARWNIDMWWKHTGLAKKLGFARDRLMESFFSAVGIVFEPQFSECRIRLTKVIKLISVLDDVFDVYGSPEELQQLTDAVDKWDVNSVNNLPDYMKLYFLALYNTVNDLAYHTLKEQGQLIISHLRQVWGDLCIAFLREANWGCKNHIPKFDEYLNHGCISSSGVVLLTHAYFLTTPTITDEALKGLSDINGLLCFPSTIFRLTNDLCSFEEDIKNGEVAKAVSCYMHEADASHEVARAYIQNVIDHNWKMMNHEITYNLIFDKSFIETSCNLARIATCHYQCGDNYTAPTDVSRNRVNSVIVEPIS